MKPLKCAHVDAFPFYHDEVRIETEQSARFFLLAMTSFYLSVGDNKLSSETITKKKKKCLWCKLQAIDGALSDQTEKTLSTRNGRLSYNVAVFFFLCAICAAQSKSACVCTPKNLSFFCASNYFLINGEAPINARDVKAARRILCLFARTFSIFPLVPCSSSMCQVAKSSTTYEAQSIN